MNLSTALQAYLIDHQIKGNSVYTIEYYRRSIRQLIVFLGDIETHKMTLDGLKSYYLHLTARNITSVSVQSYIRAVRAFVTWCYREDYIPENLSEKFRLPKGTRRKIEVLTDIEVTSLLASFDTKSVIGLRNYCICVLMLDSGLRLNEVVTLKCSALYISEGYIIVTGKGDKERYVPIGLNTKKNLLRYIMLRGESFKKTALFVKDHFMPVSRTTVRQLFRKLKNITGIERLKPHLLRHTFASRYLEHGGDIYSLQSILGHTSLEMVKRYVHTIPSKLAVTFTNYSPLDNLLKR